MKFPFAACPLLLLAVHAPEAQARTGEAEVRAHANGEPCFTISEREERRFGSPNFDSIVVTDPLAKKPVLWRMAMPRERTFPVRYSMCIPYGGRVQALPQTSAAALEGGRVYRVRIEARAARGSVAGTYEARFCLARQHDGKLLVHHIGADDHEGRRLYGCLPPLD
ncbi:hypothetical protein NX774_05275 [Massilia agilis]|uniref:DUF4431 domain-containing protein n=1 Tax=Massilia agilis TaxID=1811226 RepID=A0ABT2DA50_9BURK|nr:hypothetical protein [Massilia agilis]MCS0807333.1 hypothetical protein [Massilia agilis]